MGLEAHSPDVVSPAHAAAAPAGRASSGAADLLVCFAAALAGAAVSSLLLTHGSPLHPFPFHHDDYDLLALSVRTFGMPSVRPVSRFAASVLADGGIATFYTTLFALVVLYVAESVLVTARLLEVCPTTRGLALASLITGLVYFLFEQAPETVRYTGHLTNALSTTLGMAAALLVLPAAGGCARGARAGAAVGLFLLSLYAKEDLVLFVPAVAVLAAARGHRARSVPAPRHDAVLFAALTLAVVSIAAYDRLVVTNPFTGSIGVYATSVHPIDLATSAAWYLGATPFALAVACCLVATTVLAWVTSRAHGRRMLLVWAGVAALVAPYTPLVRHRYALYAYNWLPLMIAAIVLAGWQCGRITTARLARPVLAVLAVAGLVALAVVAAPGRMRVADDFTAQQERNRRIVSEVRRVRARLRAYDQVAVAGLDAWRQPWIFTDAAYVNREVGGKIRWLILAAPDSFAAWIYPAFDRPRDNGTVALLSTACAASLAGVPILRFDADLHATLVPPAPPTSLTGIRLDLGAPEAAGRLCFGWGPPAVRDGRAVRWAEGREANLVLPLTPAVDLRLAVTLSPPADVPRQWIGVSVDGVLVGAARVPSEGGGTAEVTLPAASIHPPVTTLTLSFFDAIGGAAPAPHAQGPAAAVERIEIGPR